MLSSVLSQIRTFLNEALPRLTPRLRRQPITTVDQVFEFTSTRSAFIAQKTLYGYVKTRMGTSYPKMFEDDVFVSSINIAKMQIFAACLSDLTIFTIAQALEGEASSDVERSQAASLCFARALADNPADAALGFDANQAQAEFEQRLDGTDWPRGAKVRDNFTRSPRALVKWSPIAPELKKYDTEIIENSIKFAWNDIRSAFLSRLDGAAVSAEFRHNGLPAGTPE